jgi:hypothetical protein
VVLHHAATVNLPFDVRTTIGDGHHSDALLSVDRLARDIVENKPRLGPLDVCAVTLVHLRRHLLEDRQSGDHHVIGRHVLHSRAAVF